MKEKSQAAASTFNAGRPPGRGRVPSPFDALPPANTKRWVIRRKAEVVAAARSGAIRLEDACNRYKLSMEEFVSWQRLIDSHGRAGLRGTRRQTCRGGARHA